MLRSICNKINCRVDGAWPTMILQATINQTMSKRLFDSESDGSDTSHKGNSENKDETTDDICNEENFDDGMNNTIERLNKT